MIRTNCEKANNSVRTKNEWKYTKFSICFLIFVPLDFYLIWISQNRTEKIKFDNWKTGLFLLLGETEISGWGGNENLIKSQTGPLKNRRKLFCVFKLFFEQCTNDHKLKVKIKTKQISGSIKLCTDFPLWRINWWLRISWNSNWLF